VKHITIKIVLSIVACE